MSEGFFKTVKSFFGSKPSKNTTNNIPGKVQPPRVIIQVRQIVSFGNDDKKQQVEEEQDRRYERLEVKQTFKQLGLKKDQIAEGETLIMSDSKFVLCKLQNQKYDNVTLTLSDYKLFIKTKDVLVHFALGKIEKLHKYINNQSFYKLLILLKDGRKFKLRIMTQPMWKKIYDQIQKFAFVRTKKHFFAFRHYQFRKGEVNSKGWQIYDCQSEFQRMGISIMPHSEDPILEYTSDYKFLDNRDGKVCSTYAERFIVPSRMPFDCLIRCSKFRSRCRMPALTFVYNYEGNKYSSLYRSSQSKVGMQNSRSPDDQMMLRYIGDHKFDAKQINQNNNLPSVIIYDARNKMAAIGNKMAGKGYESEDFYPNCRIEFLNIPNIHAVRQSYNKVQKAALGEDSKFFSLLAQSEWYDFVFLILDGSLQIANNLINGVNVLVHCSDGWDRTAQLCSLAGIMLDPFYRTIQGFLILIEKDWIRFGHQFATRMGQGANNPTGQEKSQIFLQFLDCVSQLLYQFPNDFEFNYRLLQDIAQLAYSNLYGNFLCNCQLQMIKYNILGRTVSLWEYLLQSRQNYQNPYYLKGCKLLLQISTAQKHYRFWKEHFLHYVTGFSDIYDIYSCKFTEDNLEIMYKQLDKEKSLLEEKLVQNQEQLKEIEKDIESKLGDQYKPYFVQEPIK